MFGKSKIAQALAAALLVGGTGRWAAVRAEEPKTAAKPEATSGKLVGIVVAKQDAFLMIKPEGEAEAKRYSLLGADGKVPAKLQAELKPIFSPNLVAIQWKLLQQPTVTDVAVYTPKARTGSVAGVVVARGDGSPKEFPFLDVKPPGQGYTERYVPPFTKTPDPKLKQAFADAQVGDKVKINWSYDERKRAVGIQIVAKAPPAKAGAGQTKEVLPMAKRPPRDDYFICPNCGERVKQGAKVCRHCGADDESGWSDEATDYGDDSAYDEFDYDEFVADEFPDAATDRPLAWKKIGFGLVALLLIYVLLRQMGLL